MRYFLFFAIGVVLLLGCLSTTPHRRHLLASLVDVGAQEGVSLTAKEEAHGRPLIFNAGRGTTATRFSFRATCLAGLKSVHWQAYCFQPNRTKEGSNKDQFLERSLGFAAPSQPNKAPQFSEIPKLQRVVLRHHSNLQHCAHNSSLCPEKLTPTQWRFGMQRAIDRVLLSPDIEALHDSPYTHYTPYLLQCTSHLKRQLVVILTERDPAEWAKQRVFKFARGHRPGPPLCRDALEGFNIFDAFDVFGCLERGLARSPPSTNLSFSDLFVSMNYLGRSESGRQSIVQAMARYQEAVRKVADYSVNVFVRDGKLSEAELLEELQTNVPVWPNTTMQPLKRKVFLLAEQPASQKKMRAVVKKRSGGT